MNIDKARKYMMVADAVSKLSKDRSTQVGALIIGPDGEGGPWGYNGIVRGANDDVAERHTRPTKYLYAEHAERNAIYAAARCGFATKGCSIVVTHPPCCDCMRALIQAGIRQVVCPTPNEEFKARWGESMVVADTLANECGVEYIWL